MKLHLGKLAVLLVLLSPMLASAGYIEIGVTGGTSNCLNTLPGDDCADYPINGYLRLEFSESGWIEDPSFEYYRFQWPTLHSYFFEWSAVSVLTQNTLAEDSCETGDGFGEWSSGQPLVEDSSGPNVQYILPMFPGRFFCTTSISRMNVEPSVAEEAYVEFYALEYPYLAGASNHDIGYTMAVIPEPGTFALFAIGLAGLGMSRLRRKA